MQPTELIPDTVRLFVRDLGTAREFYGGKLGLPLQTGSVEDGYLIFAPGGIYVLVEACGDDPESATLVGSFVGLSFRVASVTSAYAELTSQGVEFSEPPERQSWGGVLAHMRDPDGNVLTLVGGDGGAA